MSGTPDSPAGDDLVQPFLLPAAGVRGRLVRLGAAAEEVLTRHAYEGPVARLVAELLVLCGGLGSMMKFDGVFTIQTKGDGPVRLMVADLTSAGSLRAYAEVDHAAVARLLEREAAPSLPRLTGAGYLAFTVEQRQADQRYQGIVALEGQTLSECFLHYFRQSEQLPTAIHVAAAQVEGEAGREAWRAAALILQRLPASEHPGLEGGDEALLSEARAEGWRRATVLMSTLTDGELLDPGLTPERLLWRLFNEEAPELQPARALAAGCRCSRARIEPVLATMTPAEVAEMTVDGRITVTCQFCNRAYDFTPDEIAALPGRPPAGQ